MQVEPSVEAKWTTMTHDVRHGLERPLVLICSSNFVTLGMRTVFLVSKQDRNLSAQLREFKRAWRLSVKILLHDRYKRAAHMRSV